MPMIYGATFDCGFCNEDTPCVCREIAIQQQQAALESGIKDEDSPPAVVIKSHVPTTNILPDPEQLPTLPTHKTTQHKSILDDLPPYQPAVPLRRGVGRNKSGKSIFNVSPATDTKGASCSGDPMDCPACSDDNFGRAFCSAIGESVSTLSPCEDCPSSSNGGRTGAFNHGQSSNSRSSFELPMPTFPAQIEMFSSPPSTIALPTSSSRSQLIPTNDAWAQIKAHPHASFADLQMLADVVARKSKCTGPRIRLSPHPEIEDDTVNNTVGMLTNHRTVNHNKDSRGPGDSPAKPSINPALLSIVQREQVCCGRRRVQQVEADAVQDALRMLDAKYGSNS
jgi:AP-1-like factor